MMYVYVEHLKNSDVRFQVVEYDKTTKDAKLKGEYGALFMQNISKESLVKRGYRIRQSETELPLLSSAPSKKIVQKATPKTKVPATEEEE